MTRSLIILSAKAAMLAGVAAGALFITSGDFAHAQGQGQGGGGSESSGGGGGNSDSGSGGGGNSDSGSGGSGSGVNQDPGQRGSGGRSDAPTSAADEADDGEDDGDDRPDFAGQRGGDPDKGSTPSADSGRPEDKGGRPDGVGGGDQDSDRPDWAGTPGGSAGRGSPPDAGGGGDLFGDMYVILRDEQGVPILSPEGFPQPIAADGSLIPLDEDGHVLDESLVQEVEIGRTNVARSPESVIENRAEEVIDVLNSATAVSFDPAGRLVVTVDGVAKTIDSPLENLAIYVALMTTGTIDGVDNPALGDLFLVDGEKTAEDLAAATTFLAAATDKSSAFTTDEIAYVNLILDIDTKTIEGTNVTYSAVDYSTFTYDRQATFGDVSTTILVQQEDGSWMPTEVNIYETIFGSATDTAADGTLEAFTQAADDARMVINYIHEYEVPVPPDQL
jgi:hypothetical protein